MLQLYEVLNFLKLQLESYISEGRGNGEPILELGNPWSNKDNNQNATFLNAISLINVEEEKIFKTQEPPVMQNKNGNYFRKEPDLKLNLYMLISSYNKKYEDALKFMSKVVSFFQQKNVFRRDEKDTHPDLPAGVEKILVELYTVGFEQQNQIWASLGTGYIPSVIYKVRMIIIETEVEKEFQPIKEIKASY